MTHGGKREGAGRPFGATNKRTREMLEAAEAGGKMPLEYMLAVTRDEGLDAATRMDAAKAAAPYIHPKLASVSCLGEDGEAIRPEVKVVLTFD